MTQRNPMDIFPHAPSNAGTPKPTDILSPDIRRDIDRAMMRMFAGLSLTNWLRGMTLGAGWYESMRQMESFVATKTPTNPAVAYMRERFEAHRTHIARNAMTHPNREMILNCDDNVRGKLSTIAAQITRDAMGKLNKKFADFHQSNTADIGDTQHVFSDAMRRMYAQMKNRANTYGA